MELTTNEWEQVRKWLIGYRVQCSSNEKEAKHEKIADFYREESTKVRDFLNSKTDRFNIYSGLEVKNDSQSRKN